MDRVRSVQKVTDGALAHLSLDELLAELLDRVRDVMKVDTVAILLLESDGDELVAWAARGLEEEVELGTRIPVGAGFAGRIAATKAPVLVCVAVPALSRAAVSKDTSSKGSVWVTAGSALTICAAAAGYVWWTLSRRAPARVAWLSVPLPGQSALALSGYGDLALTPDGSRLPTRCCGTAS